VAFSTVAVTGWAQLGGKGHRLSHGDVSPSTNTGWWFGTFFIFHNIWDNHPN